MRKMKKQWNVSAKKNRDMEFIWEMRLFDIVLNLYKWKNVPDEIDETYIEKALSLEGNIAYSTDEITSVPVMLPANTIGQFDLYGNPVRIQLFSPYTYYNINRIVGKDACFCWNNSTRTNSYMVVETFAQRLYDLDRSIDVNAQWQKTPALIRTTKEKELSIKNALMNIMGNYSVVIGDKHLFEEDTFIDPINCPFVGDKISMLRRDIFYEFLTWFGVENSDVQKKERLVSTETSGNDGAIEMSRNTMITQRKKFCRQVNELFGTDMDVEFNSELETLINGYAISANKESFKDEEIYTDKEESEEDGSGQ